MSKDIIEESLKADKEFSRQFSRRIEEFTEASNNFFSSIEALVLKFQKTGIVPPITAIPSVVRFSRESKNDDESPKENKVVKKGQVSPQKPKRKALKENMQNEKVSEAPQYVTVKQEKLSTINAVQNSSMEEMPPPTLPLQKVIKVERNTRLTRSRTKRVTKIKTEVPDSEEETRKDSDVVLQPVVNPVLEISSDSDAPSESEDTSRRNASNASSTKSAGTKTTAKKDVMRSTRSRARAVQTKTETERLKRSRSGSTEEITTKTKIIKSKRTKRKKAEVETDTESSSAFEDAVNEAKQPPVSKENGSATAYVQSQTKTNPNSEANKILDETYVKQNSLPPAETATGENIINETFTQPANKNHAMNETYAQSTAKKDQNLADIMTDDDSPITNSTKTKNVPLKGKTKQLFSPFEKSPVKKKVQAYENLVAEAATRTTRTKTRALAKLQDAEEKTEEKNHVSQGAVPKQKPLYTTPLAANRFLMHTAGSHSTSKLMKQNSNENLLPTKAFSSIKASQAEFREREMRRQKEAQKREALIQAQMEEKRKKREEKQLKAQQQRQALEKEKLKHLEQTEKLKEEKLKQAMAERELKMQKQKEEAEHKRQIAKQKAIEEKLREEAKRRMEAKQKKAIQEPTVPPYFASEAPRLPTTDCYDSDEDCDTEPVNPAWAEGIQLEKTLRCMRAIGEEQINKFFCPKTETVDLKEIFVTIDPRKLRRTSSALWHTPPRFAFIPGELETTMERNNSSTDEE